MFTKGWKTLQNFCKILKEGLRYFLPPTEKPPQKKIKDLVKKFQKDTVMWGVKNNR